MKFIHRLLSQKSYYDSKHRDMVYAAGDKAYLRVTPLRGTHRFGVKGKLAPRYVGPFNILSRRAENAYLAIFSFRSLPHSGGRWLQT